MTDQLEIIVSVYGESQPRTVAFQELFSLVERIQSMMLLWNANSYYVDTLTNTFLINGGRKINPEGLGPCKIMYRKRGTIKMSLTNGASEREEAWLLGLESKDNPKKMLFLEITGSGTHWAWKNAL